MRLVTGGSGMVGRQVSGDVHLSFKDCDLTNFSQVRDVFRELRPTEIVHLAAKVGGVQGNINYPGQFYEQNMMMNTNVLCAARRFGVKKLLYASSSCIYSPQAPLPSSENHQHIAPPFESHEAYAYTKRMLDVQARAYRSQWGSNFTGFVLVNLYGPNDNFDEVNGHIIPSLISRCIRSKEEGTDFEVWGSGWPLREVVYVKDVGRIIDILMDNYNEPEPVNISPGTELHVREIAETIAQAVGFKGNITYNTAKPDGQLRKPTDNTKLLKYLPKDFKWTPLSQGLSETVEWYLNNKDKVRR